MIRFFAGLRRQRRALVFAFVALCVLGVVTGLRRPAAILPEVTFPRVKVIADSGELPGDEMLRAVTRPLEEALGRVPGIREMRSVTSRGSTEINLDCAWRSDMDLTLQRVQAQIDATRADLPAGTALDARLMNPTLFPVFGFSLTSQTRSLAELRDLAVTVLKPELARLPGVADIVVQGGRRLEARVTLDPAALQARGLDAAGVADVLRQTTEIQSVGLLDLNHELYLGLTDARPPDLAALGATPIPVAGGLAAPLRDLGRIALEEAPEFTRYAARGREAVLVNLMRKPAASTLELADGFRRWLAGRSPELLAGIRVETFYDQSDLVRSSVTSVRDSLLIGALLAIIVVALFLSSLRLGLAGAIVLPGSIGLTLLGFTLTGQSLNMMTLGGIAAAVGLVLDDAIVVVEHLAHRAAHGGPAGGISAAMAEILPSLAGSSLCTISIFLPFMLLGGVTGAFFRVLALAMVLMLSASLLTCLAILPLLSGFRPVSPRPPRPGARFPRAVHYAATHVWVAVVPPLLLIAAIVPLRATLGSGFLPAMDEGSLILDYVLPAGTSLTESEHLFREIEREIAATPDIVAWSRRTGDQLGFFITEPNVGDYVLRLKDGRRPGAEAIADDLRGRLEGVLPSVQVEFGQLIEDVIGDLTTNPQPIDVRILGEDRRVLADKARLVSGLLARCPGVVDVSAGVVAAGPDLTIVPGPGAARLGLNGDDLARAVQPALAGIDAGRIVRGARVWPVRVCLPGPARGDEAAALNALPVPIAPGRWVRLDEVATLRVNPGETEIERDNQRTMISVTARLSGRSLGAAMTEIRRTLRRELPLPRGMSVEYGGLWAEQQSSFRGLASVMVGAIAAVLLILVASFRSWRQTGAVLVVVAASLAGAFAALLVAGATFNISSFVGAIMIVGIVSENAYFLVAEHRQGQRAGASPADAAVAAARRRARPILMTTAAGIAALTPLALGLSAGSAILSPLAVAVVGGFLTSAPLLLFVLPALLARAGAAD
ncbi:MAG: efflux RND transporter permease subunit [Candidatus Krumholzibacteriia bacterium]